MLNTSIESVFHALSPDKLIDSDEDIKVTLSFVVVIVWLFLKK